MALLWDVAVIGRSEADRSVSAYTLVGFMFFSFFLSFRSDFYSVCVVPNVGLTSILCVDPSN